MASIVGTLRAIGEGLTWNRLQRLRRCAGVPLPASVQWQLVRDAHDRGIKAAYDHLLGEGAQGELMHNDDAGMCVLALEEKLKKQQPLLEKDPDRCGVFTTGHLGACRQPTADRTVLPALSRERIARLARQT